MKPRSERLQLVLELEERKEEAAKESLAKAKAYFDQQRTQLENLAEYQGQYLVELKQSMQGVSAVAQLQQYQSFINQINRAIEQQQLVVDHARVQFENERKVWLERREKVRGFSDLVKRSAAEEMIARDKKLEKQIEDDFLGRLQYRK